jgi:thiamine monophosphate kinase
VCNKRCKLWLFFPRVAYSILLRGGRERSGCRLVVELERVPVAGGVAKIAERIGADVYSLACAFGEDYELLAWKPQVKGHQYKFATV